jgi:peptidoglycan hydrolase-like protein with peptidoglycan-binding domain
MSKITYIALISILFLTPVFVAAQSAQNTSVPEFARSLSLGMQGNDVKSLQEFLARDTNIYPEGLATGYFGQKTQTAVKKWQQKYGIEAVGIVGPKTIAKIKEIGRSATKESVQPAVTIPDANVLTTPTAQSPADTTTPTVTLALNVAAPTSIYIQFTPSEEVTAVYEYGLTANYGLIKEVSNQYSSSPAGISLENLVSSTTYQIRAKVTDKAGNIGHSKNYTFTTPSLSDAPMISYGPTVTPSDALPKTSVNISWGTNIACTGTAYYDANATFGNSKTSGYETNHSVVITGLASGATYILKIHCDTADKAVKSDNFIFIATSTDSSPSAAPNPFLANILKIFEGIIQRFKF